MDEMRYQMDLLTAINQKLGDQEKMYRLVCESSVNAYLYYSFESNEFTCMGNWNNFFDFEVKKREDLSMIYDIVDEKNIPILRNNLFLEKRGKEQESVECHISGKNVWYQFTTKVIYGEQDEPLDKIITVSDISKYKNQTEELIRMAYYDMSTGLYSRNYFVMVLGGFLRKAEEEKVTVSVLFVDIDDFKRINDGMGIVVGEGLLQSFAAFLKEFESEKVIISHFTGDLFCIAIYDPCGTRSVDHICKAIKEKVLEGIISPDGQKLLITACIGVAEYPEASNNALGLINCAEIVMFKAKASGKNMIKYYDTPIIKEFMHNVEIENKLKNAVFQKEFVMYFQPQFYVNSRKLRGAEALIRWYDKEEKFISPGVFIPIAEKNGMIVTIGQWVIEESIRNFAEWKKQFDCHIILSINISAIQYKQPNFVTDLIRIMQKYNIPANELELEITESILIEDFEEVVKKLNILRSHGIKISLDDFGTGYSSLSYLKEMPIDTLKVDKSFVDTIITDSSTKIITGAIIQMVKELGYETIAEGVEEQGQCDYLKAIGCDIIQGYFFGKPMPSEKIAELLREQL